MRCLANEKAGVERPATSLEADPAQTSVASAAHFYDLRRVQSVRQRTSADVVLACSVFYRQARHSLLKISLETDG
jgi:hypothetical protein